MACFLSWCVCDEDKKLKSFHLVQTDAGLIDPSKRKSTPIPTASRLSIMIDLNKFKNNVAYLCFHNYDLTEILDTEPTFPNDPNNSTLTATIPDLKASSNPTPYPTPIQIQRTESTGKLYQS